MQTESVESNNPPVLADGRIREALSLWLRWNSAHERVTSVMFQAELDQRKLEEAMDELDLLRQQAVRLSEELLRAHAE